MKDLNISDKFEIVGIKRKSTANMFKDAKVGDILKMEVSLIQPKYAKSRVIIKNLTQGTVADKTIIRLREVLTAFELKRVFPVKEDVQ